MATNQILTHRNEKTADFTHLSLFDERDRGLIIYDEVHLLPAPVFQVTATLQARRRLGLTATLVREDRCEVDVFALIGPKKADVPWKALERQGWIAKASCTEVRLPLPEEQRIEYAMTDPRGQFHVASENPAKAAVVRTILAGHPGEQALVIGMYVDQLKALAVELNAPLLTGATSQRRRDQLFHAFREGRMPVLVVSKVANFAIDLPDAALTIQVSGTFGSRQEEAQRLGRPLRPKHGENQAHFYTLVTRETRKQEFALNRQLFLCEQGYQYRIVDVEEGAEAIVGQPEPSLFDATRPLVQAAMSWQQPVRLIELPQRLPDVEEPRLWRALMATVRYFLLFPRLGEDHHEPVIGVWAQIAYLLHRPEPAPPRPVEPAETFHAPYLVEDMTAVLVAAAAEPLRLLASREGRYQKDTQRAGERLMVLPDW